MGKILEITHTYVGTSKFLQLIYVGTYKIE